MPADFVSKHLKKFESDLIWRVRHGPGDGDWFYVVILLELQSTSPRFMALRLWGYMQHIALAIVRDRSFLASRRPRLLPPILPVVLYNGEKPWTAPLSLAQLFRPMEGYEPPDFEYIVLDVRRYPPEALEPVTNVASGVFRLEQADSVEELTAVFEELEELRQLADNPELAEDIRLLLHDVAIKLDLKGQELPSTTLEEMRMSLLERAEKWTQQWFAEGLAAGKAEGLATGKAEGLEKGQRLKTVEILRTLLEQRFGDLPLWVVDRISRADVATLDSWVLNVLTAERLEDVVGAPPRQS